MQRAVLIANFHRCYENAKLQALFIKSIKQPYLVDRSRIASGMHKFLPLGCSANPIHFGSIWVLLLSDDCCLAYVKFCPILSNSHWTCVSIIITKTISANWQLVGSLNNDVNGDWTILLPLKWKVEVYCQFMRPNCLQHKISHKVDWKLCKCLSICVTSPFRKNSLYQTQFHWCIFAKCLLPVLFLVFPIHSTMLRKFCCMIMHVSFGITVQMTGTQQAAQKKETNRNWAAGVITLLILLY